ncbi:MAG: adenylate kinase [Coleofasciculus sp. G1-WW12-02]|uniref:adenylate kinase n=1 Tax=Coleofasciculus sp. G1-WW12-02 TaxID=3068483 RepID=UPI0032F8C8A5
MTRLVFLGPPGAGKGTQAQLIAQLYQIPHISTGEILRSAIAQSTPLGQKAQSYMDRGELVPDELILDLIRDRLQQPDTQAGWILDGFPRNVSQGAFLENLLQDLDQRCDYAIYLDVSDESILKRLLSRGRQDDNEQTIRRRLEVYRQQTAPVIEFYRDRSILREIDGDRPMDEVTGSLKQVMS